MAECELQIARAWRNHMLLPQFIDPLYHLVNRTFRSTHNSKAPTGRKYELEDKSELKRTWNETEQKRKKRISQLC